MRRFRAFCFRALIAVLVCLAAGEVALRAKGFSVPIWYQPDATLGWVMRPGTKGWFTEEGRARGVVSAAGFRDRSHELAKPKNTYRIALLGDAYAEALQVEFKDGFGWQLQEKLAACAPAGTHVEVMNFGVGGYGTAQESILLEQTAIRYEPDLVLLAFTNGNDLVNNSRALDAEKNRPFYTVDAGGTLRLDDSFARSAEYQQRAEPWLDYFRAASDRFRVLQMAERARRTLEAMSAGTAQANDQAGRKPIPGAEPGSDAAVLAPPRDAAWQGAWSVTEALIARMNAFSTRHGARFALALVPASAQVHPDPDLRRNLQNALGVPDLFYIEHRMEALGRKEGFAVIPLAYDMQRRADGEHVFLHGFRNVGMGVGHWNETGHRMAADLVAKRLCDEAFRPAMQRPGGWSGE